MSHSNPLSSTKITTYQQYRSLQDSERTKIAFTSALTAITTINILALALILNECENTRCPAADISCTDVAIATTWVALGGMIGKTNSLTNFKRIQSPTLKEKQQIENFKRNFIKIASAGSALMLQGFFKLTLGLTKCLKNQTKEGLSGHCYETNIALIHAVSVIGLLGSIIFMAPHCFRDLSRNRSYNTLSS